ncbi:uncharacterized protein LOC115212253 [Octopus sinensis]|uniref:Uncharacterized protein LOC115212253 n=1 Tax=Octopus sinensis TaxID=2607531 RepID=A0A6P7SF20_9MOLL|nr:uncharacterized protein LOC115212253 [Octopus sinensis]
MVNEDAEFLNSQDPPPLPLHELHLNVGCPVIFLCNLNALTLCNETRFVVKQMLDNVIEDQIIMGHDKNDTVFIPKIPLTPNTLLLPYAETSVPSHTRSLKVVGLDPRTSCFSHEQFYVGCSGAGHPDTLFIYAPEEKKPKMSSTKQPYSSYFSTAIFISSPKCS